MMIDWDYFDFKTEGLTLRVWTHGPEDAPPILCLHGFTGSGRDFTPLVEAWQGEPLRWIAPDLPGHGDSAGDPGQPELYTWRRTVGRLEQLTETLFSPAVPARLFGYSMGGRLSLALVCRLPRYFSRLFVVGASPGLREESARRDRAAEDERLARMIESEGVDAFLEHWNAQPLIASQTRIEPSYRKEMLERRRAANGRAWAAILRGSGTGQMPPLWDRLPNIRQPVLVAVGEDDRRFIKIAQDIYFRIPKSHEAVIPGAGHAAHMESPQETERAMRLFLAEYAPPVREAI